MELIFNHDKMFLSQSWHALHKLTDTKLKLSTAYHPETDRVSKHTNKTVNQCIHYHVKCSQKSWVHALPIILFNIMNTINKSTGFCPFQLRMGCSPCILPPLVPNTKPGNTGEASAQEIIKSIHIHTVEAYDNLARAKISQAAQSNKSHTLTFPFRIGDHIHLSTLHRKHEFKNSGGLQVAKFMPHFNGPLSIVVVNESKSMVTLDLPPNSKRFPVFHTSEVLPYKENDLILFPSWEFTQPIPITDDTGNEEFLVHDIIDKLHSGHGFKYLVHWVGYSEEENHWLPRKLLEETEALDTWLAEGLEDFL